MSAYLGQTAAEVSFGTACGLVCAQFSKQHSRLQLDAPCAGNNLLNYVADYRITGSEVMKTPRSSHIHLTS